MRLCARQRDEAPARSVLTRRGPVSYRGMRVATSEIYHAAEGRFPIRCLGMRMLERA